MLADQLYTVRVTLVEGESFDILVCSGSGEGLEAWRRLHKRWGYLTGRARGWLREILSPGRAKLKGLQGAVETTRGLDGTLHTKERCSEWSAPHAGGGHQDGGVGSASS